MTFWQRLRVLWQMTDLVEWTCEYCHNAQVCSMLLWPDLRYNLICRYCKFAQSYPGYIQNTDPLAHEQRR